MNIYTLPRTPGATDTTEWTAFCHSKEPFLVIDHSTWRHTSRWTGTERKRPFRVSYHVRSSRGAFNRGQEHWFATLAKAQAFAAKLATERETNDHPPA